MNRFVRCLQHLWHCVVLFSLCAAAVLPELLILLAIVASVLLVLHRVCPL